MGATPGTYSALAPGRTTRGGPQRPARPEKAILNKQHWRTKAACKGLDPSIFYPATEDEDDAQPAKAVCSECAVREECLEYALGFREHEGVWGGATERERRRIIRQRRRAAYAAAARRSA